MNKNDVSITWNRGPFHNAKSALEGLDLSLLRNKSVLIKPNAGREAHKGHGITTDPEAVAGTIEALTGAGVSRMAIGESPIVGVNTLTAFETTGIGEVARRYNIPLIDLNNKPPIEKEIHRGMILKSTKICAQIFDFDIILSLPVAKCHMHTGVTLGMKNLKGCLYKYEKVRYHQLEYETEYPEKTLDAAISDLGTILLPDLTVIDGYIGMEGLGPSGGEPIKSNFAVASFNPVGADFFGCKMMGIDPVTIPHIRLNGERNGFSLDESDYNVITLEDEDYREHVVPFKRTPEKFSIEYPDVILYDKESCSACLSTVMLFLKRFHSNMGPYIFPDGKLHLAIGKGLSKEELHKDTIMIGNCTRKCCLGGKVVPGCPPVPTRIYKEITGKEPEKNEPDLD